MTDLCDHDPRDPRSGPLRKVFGIGLSRTGTTSLTRALEVLGYRAVHFPADLVTQAEVSAFLMTPASELRLSLLDSVDAATDTPITATYRAIDRAYPGSAFVLTVRDRESWLRSCEIYWDSFLARLYDGGLNAPYVRLINQQIYSTDRFDPERFIAVSRQHEAQVHAHFDARQDNLLTLDICRGEGWHELCAFLGLDVPTTPFPHANASGS